MPTEIRPLGAERTLTVGQPGPVDYTPPPSPAVVYPPRPPAGYDRPARPPTRPPSRRRGWIALLVVLLLAIGAGAGGWWYGVGRFQSTPDVVGLTQTAAQSKIEEAGLTFKIADTAYSETVAAGKVISTDPGAGDKVVKDGTVKVVVSRGPERHDVPTLDGMSEEDARAALDASHLKAKVDYRYNRNVAEGNVVSSDPDSGVLLRRDSVVTLVVSKGPKPVEITDFSGQRAKDVVHQLEDAGLTVTRHYHYDDDVKRGLVVRTAPSDGTLFAGDAIDVYVSRGPHLVEVPNVHFYGVDAAVRTLTAAGFVVDKKDADPSYGLGFVVGQDPDGGAMAPYGSKVTIYIS
jgi:serine/threonine-protein kinase